MSAGLWVVAEEKGTAAGERAAPEMRIVRPLAAWDPERFAREQIRGLVRQVFSASETSPVRQVVFSAVEAETNVHNICQWVGETLAMETLRDVAIVEVGATRPENHLSYKEASESAVRGRGMPLRVNASRERANLWRVSGRENGASSTNLASLHTYLNEIRRQFEYSIVEGDSAGGSNDAAAMAQFADGLVLVLSAKHTRRITARKIQEMLQQAQIRLLGTVLSDREFPIPERIYRRL